MALGIDSRLSGILDELSKKHGIEKHKIYFIIDYKFKKIRDLLVGGKVSFKDLFPNNRVDEEKQKLMDEKKLIFEKITMEPLMSLNFNETKFDKFNEKFNKEQQQEQSIKEESKDNNRLLGTQALF